MTTALRLADLPPDADSTLEDATPPSGATAIEEASRAAWDLAPRAVVVIGPGQVVTSVVLRSLGWRVDLVSSAAEAAEIARQHEVTLIFIRVSSSYLRSLRRPPSVDATVVAIVDAAEDAPLPGFDATVAIDDVDELSSFIRSAAPTTRAVRLRRTSDVVPKMPSEGGEASSDEGQSVRSA
jgi:hypothetical protein